MTIGDIGPILDTLHVEDNICLIPTMCHISGHIYACVYRGPGNDGTIKTVRIASNGQILSPVIDTYEFDTSLADYPHMVKVAGTTYAIAYASSFYEGWVRTLTIADDGTITKSIIDSLMFDFQQVNVYSFIKIAANYFAVAYSLFTNNGWLRTIYIADDGDIAAAPTSSWNFEIVTGKQPRLIHIATTVYCLCYAGPDNHGLLKTFPISDFGIIGAQIDTLIFDMSFAVNLPYIVNATGTYYAIAYSTTGTDGYICTVDIANDGTITPAVVDGYEFDTSTGNYMFLISAGDQYLALCYRGAGNQGLLRSFSVSALGMLSNPPLGYLHFDNPLISTTYMLHIAGDVFAFFYQAPSNTGHLKTVNIESTFPIVYALSGTIKEQGSPVQRTVKAYIRSTAALYSSDTSAPDGTFSLDAPDDTTEMFVIAFDDDAGEDYNALIYDRVKGVAV